MTISLAGLLARARREINRSKTMTKQQLIKKAREYNHHLVSHIRAGRTWAADLAADTRDAAMAEARMA